MARIKKVKAYALFEDGMAVDCSIDLGADHGLSKAYLVDEMNDFREQSPDYHFRVGRVNADDYLDAVHERIGTNGKELIDWLVEDLQGIGVSVEEVLEQELSKYIAKP